MKTIDKIDEIRNILDLERKVNRSIALVPTMGFLHEGHLSLIKEARKNNDIVVVSIFVNPTQFGPGEDLETYPRDINRDQNLCKNEGVDYIFNPSVDEMYEDNYATYVITESNITNKLCGASREGHFKGVMSVVTKLFNIIRPSKAYFGRKDYQQVAVIKKMVNDLNIPVEIIDCPIVRESDGLAMSSRNTYLEPNERKDALVLNESLKEAKERILKGEKNKKVIREEILDKINEIPYSEIDYVEILDAKTLENIEIIDRDVVIALAVKIGKPRLIDNIIVEG
ncbi:MAG TPA: pantoate--beta-alanine ligase [Clostridia bacterium]|nr:pantoate--beta-alanine ligase [Clostridia bacterium]